MNRNRRPEVVRLAEVLLAEALHRRVPELLHGGEAELLKVEVLLRRRDALDLVPEGGDEPGERVARRHQGVGRPRLEHRGDVEVKADMLLEEAVQQVVLGNVSAAGSLLTLEGE